MSIQQISRLSDLEKLLSENKVVVIDFYTEWCGPCKAAKPGFKALSEEFPNVVFVKIDLEQDENGQMASKYNVRSIPVFMILSKGHIDPIYRRDGFNQQTFNEMRNVLNKI